MISSLFLDYRMQRISLNFKLADSLNFNYRIKDRKNAKKSYTDNTAASVHGMSETEYKRANKFGRPGESYDQVNARLTKEKAAK